MTKAYNQVEYLRVTIERAFANVTLEDGVSLHEADVIDDYGSVEERQAARNPDEKKNWKNLLTCEDFQRMHWCMSFYDAKGFRFHLPAYLYIAVTQPDHDLVSSLLFQLTDIGDYQAERFSILAASQRACIRKVLKFLRHNTGKLFEFEAPNIDRAISGYWKSQPRDSSNNTGAVFW